jgi:hypothetical protein
MSAWDRDPEEKTDWVTPLFFIGSILLIGVAWLFEKGLI